MIFFNFQKRKKYISEVIISGHALFDVPGKDIVCSSVSTAIIMSINLIDLFQLKEKIHYQMKEGFCKIIILEYDQYIEKIIINLKKTLQSLSLQYPSYIKKERKNVIIN